MATTTPRIFISHSHEDDAFCRRLIADLRANLGEDAVWYDTSGGLHGSDDWWDRIVAEITERSYFLVVLSPAASASNWVPQEMKIAFRQHVELGKRLLPVRLADSPRREDWRGIQEFDFTQSNDPALYATALAEILHAIDPDISKPVISTAPTSSIPAPPERPLSTTERLAREAHTAYGREHWSDVLDKTEILVERGAMTPALWRERASSAFALGDNKIGLEVVKQALKAGPDDADTLLLYVRLTARAGDDALAVDIFRNAYALVPLDDTAARLTILEEWIAALPHLGRWDEFVRRVDDARRISSNDPRWTLRSVEALLADRKFDEAIAASSHIPHDAGMYPLLPVWQTAIAAAVGAGNWSLRHNLLEAARGAGVDSNTIARWHSDFAHFVLIGTISPYQLNATNYPGDVQTVAWASDSAHLATFRMGNPVKIWEAATGRLLLTLPDQKNEGMRVMACSPNGACLATAYNLYDPKEDSHNSKVKIWEMATGRILATLERIGEIRAIALAPDNSRLAISNATGGEIWSIVTQQQSATTQGTHALLKWVPGLRPPVAHAPVAFRGGAYAHLAWSPDGVRIASAADSDVFGRSEESKIQIWEASTGRLLGTTISTGKGRYSSIRAVAWSPDNVRLAIASNGQKIFEAEIFEADSGRLLVSLTDHSADVRAVAWSPDGTKLATASDDWTARVWEANSGGMLATLTGHSGAIHDIAWSPNGMYIATASADGTVKIWRAE